jgi:hypothetical protein
VTPKLYTRKLFQSTPKLGDPERHGFNWKTLHGFLTAAKRLVGQLLANERLAGKRYIYDGTINVLADLDVDQIRKVWAKISRKLKAVGMVAIYVREVSRYTNRVGYHLVIRECPQHLLDKDAKALKAVVRSVCAYKLNMQFEPIRSSYSWANYILKAEVKGKDRKTPPADDTDDVDEILARPAQDDTVEDVYAGKRVLFADDVNLSKHGDIGPFWVKKRADLDKEFKSNRKAVKEAMQLPEIEGAANRLADITGLHPEYLRKRLAQEMIANPGDKELRKQNSRLADEYLRSTPEYREMADELRKYEQRVAADAEFFDGLHTGV